MCQFAIPILKSILRRIAQLTNGGIRPFAELDVGSAALMRSSYEYMNYLLLVQEFVRTSVSPRQVFSPQPRIRERCHCDGLFPIQRLQAWFKEVV